MPRSTETRGVGNVTVIKSLLMSVLLVAPAMAPVAHAAEQEDAIAVTYYHYPPKLRIENGQPVGAYAEGLEKIVAKAGLKLEWLKSTINEEAHMLDDGRRSFCTTGRYYTDERGKRWTFLPYLFDTIPADVVVTTKAMAETLHAHGTMAKVVRDQGLIGTLLGSAIYGEPIDSFLRTNPAWIFRDGKTDFQLVRMVEAGRAHYAIVPEDQWQILADRDPHVANLVMYRDMGTLPSTPLFLVCSHGVEPDKLAKLEGAMAALGYQYHPLEEDAIK